MVAAALLVGAGIAGAILFLPVAVAAALAGATAAALAAIAAIAVGGRTSAEDAIELYGAEAVGARETVWATRRAQASVLGRLGAGVVTLGPDGTVTGANEFFLSMVGLEARDVVGRDMTASVWSASGPAAFEEVRSRVAERGAHAEEWTLTRRSGEAFEASVVIAASHDGALVATITDLSRDRARARSLARERDRASATADLAAEDLERVRRELDRAVNEAAAARAAVEETERVADLVAAGAEVAATVAAAPVEHRPQVALERVAASLGAEAAALYAGERVPALIASVGPGSVAPALEAEWAAAPLRALSDRTPVWATGDDAAFGWADVSVDREGGCWELHVPLTCGDGSLAVMSLGAASSDAPAGAAISLATQAAAAVGSHPAGEQGVDVGLLGLVSREMRTPLTSVAGYLQEVVDDLALQPDDDAYQLLDAAGRNAARLESLVDDLVTLSEVDGLSTTSVEVVELSEIVSEVCAEAAPEARRLGVELVLLLDGSAPVAGDDVTLERAVANLVSNALRFTPAGGRVDVSVAARGDRALVEVADNGLDIAPEDLGDLFAPDRDGPVSSRASLGAGFGLAVVKAVVDAHEGEVAASSAGDGVTFTVSLPLAAGAGASRTAAPLSL